MVDGIARGSLAGQPAQSAGLVGRLRPAGRFVGHYVEMVVAMIVGMVVLGIPVDAVARSQGYDDLYHQLPELGTIVMTAIMTGPMALWMAVRGHDRRMIGEMSLAMVAPAVGLIAAARLGLLAGSSVAMLADPLMYVAMLAVMVARWRMYAGLVHGHEHR
ncbi:MAG TPA: hypothetical protein VK194_09415 [Candidatus Deferrimicrobium sp.]|nr:hypothetical protein [Candidatus Deferrimicrobium sp.]